jgi:hypothetical protein
VITCRVWVADHARLRGMAKADHEAVEHAEHN